MPSITATPNPILIDNLASPPETQRPTEINYQKHPDQQLWVRRGNGPWTRADEFTLTGQGAAAATSGRYTVPLAAGDFYTAAIFEPSHAPDAADPIVAASVTAFAVLQGPRERQLIRDHSGSVGGTWLDHVVSTKVPTSLVVCGASRTRPSLDGAGIPTLVKPDAVQAQVGNRTALHTFRLSPLIPGHHYFLTVMVVDATGNWEVRQFDLDTLRRQVTVQFPTIHVFNDGDPMGHGEAEFWFRVSAGGEGRAHDTLQEFHLATMDIDDWSETDRPYQVGFAYTESQPRTVPPDRPHVWISSRATEHDGFLEPDEFAGKLDATRLPLPTGPGEVTTGNFTMDCPNMSGADFHYGVDVTFSVDYQP